MIGDPYYSQSYRPDVGNFNSREDMPLQIQAFYDRLRGNGIAVPIDRPSEGEYKVDISHFSPRVQKFFTTGGLPAWNNDYARRGLNLFELVPMLGVNADSYFTDGNSFSWLRSHGKPFITEGTVLSEPEKALYAGVSKALESKLDEMFADEGDRRASIGGIDASNFFSKRAILRRPFAQAPRAQARQSYSSYNPFTQYDPLAYNRRYPGLPNSGGTPYGGGPF